jgi:hypothetical protein
MGCRASLHLARCASQRSCRLGGPLNVSLWGQAFPVHFSYRSYRYIVFIVDLA